MDSQYKIEVLQLKRIRGDKYRLILQIESAEFDCHVNIIEDDGVFGVEMPDEIEPLLHDFPMSHKEVVKSVKAAYQKSFSDRRLQAA